MTIHRLIFTPTVVLSVLAASLIFASVPAQATGRSEIGRFGPGGPASGVFLEAQSIAVEQSTHDVYVYESAEEGGNVYKFNEKWEPLNGKGEAAANPEGEPIIHGVGGEAHAMQIAVDNSSGSNKGDIYIANGTSVSIYDSEGMKLGTLTEADAPCGVAVDPNGNVYVGLVEAEEVKRYASTTAPVKEADYTSSLWGVGNVCNLAVDPIGDAYVAGSNGAGGVTKYAASQFNTGGNSASGALVDSERSPALTVDPVSGDVYIDQRNKIVEYSSSGTLLESFGELAESYGVAVNDTSGEVYAASETEEEAGEDEVIVFGPASAPATEYVLTVTPEGSGAGSVKDSEEKIDCLIAGGTVSGTCSEKYTEGKEVELTATEEGGTFAGWTGCATVEGVHDEICKVAMTEAKEVTATFNPSATPKDTLTIAKSGTGEVKCKIGSGSFTSCASEYNEGTELTLEGVASSGWTFEGWSGAGGSALGSCDGTISNCGFTITEDAAITATFGPSAITEYTLSVYVVGKGVVTSKPSGINCSGTCSHIFQYGEEIELKATPEPGYEFLGWIGCRSAGAICQVEGTRETEVAAVFSKEPEKGEKGAQGTQGAKGEKGEKGEPGINGTNGGRGLAGPIGEVGPAGAQGEEGPAGASGTNGKSGAQGPAGAAGAQGPAGPAGHVELVTCKTITKGKRHMQECTTKLVSGTVKFTTSGMAASAALSRHGHVFAAGAARLEPYGRVRLRLAPLRKLRAGRYTLTLISGTGSHERIKREAFTLR
jgi:hypothetical protein